jgi:peptidoglycan/LPS O-acetylase OafA/YrhL
MNDKQKLIAADSLRGIAALMVLFYHLAELVKLPLPPSLAIIRTHFGLGVPLFYLLSGFVLAYGYAHRLEKREDVWEFYIRRLFRIAPLFYAMLLIWLVTSWFVWNKLYSASTLFLNFFFLFGLVPGYHESIVWAGWSIGIEMLFYLLFPVFACLFAGVRSTAIGFLVACILSVNIHHALDGAGMGSYAYMNLGTHLPFFLAGMLSFRIWEVFEFAENPRLGKVLLIAAACCSLAMAWRIDNLPFLRVSQLLYLERCGWAIVFGLAVVSACLSRAKFLERGPLPALGRVSFSLYLVHPFLMLWLIRFDFVTHLKGWLPGTWSAFLVGSLLTILAVWGVSELTHRWIEAPGIAAGRRFARRFSRLGTQPSQSAHSTPEFEMEGAQRAS